MEQNYDALRSAVQAPVDQHIPKHSWWSKVFKWSAVGCGGFFALMFALSVVAAWLGPKTSSSPALSTKLPAAEGSAAMPMDTVVPALAKSVQMLPPTQPDTAWQSDFVPAQPVATSKPKPDPKPKQAGITVYTTRTGNHYHRSNCSSLRKSKNATTLEQAQQIYTPCGRCKPPR